MQEDRTLKGYAGKIGWIDLTSGDIREEPLDNNTARKYLGGKALGGHLLYKHLKPGTDPLDPENIMVFITGPLTGTNLPAVSRSGIVTGSPLTGTFLDSYSGGFFGAQLKWAGFDGLVVMGKSSKPSYLLVKDGKISILDAAEIWGLGTIETERLLKEKHQREDGKKISVAAIGPAGENGVLYASIINERRAHGRGGPGAVMGSKNLKAVVASGYEKPDMADPDAFRQIVKQCRQRIAEHPLTKKGGDFPKYGTTSTPDLTNATGTMPTRNWKENTYEGINKVDGEAFLQYKLKPRSCYSCPITCSRDSKVVRKGIEYFTEGPDYETIYAFGPHCGIDDTKMIIAADSLCDDYGMDTISCGVTIGFIMECFEKGYITKEQTGGMELNFGDSDSVLDAIHLIAKREGIGNLLADGTRKISEKLQGSDHFAIHVKGMELPGYDPRGMKGQGLTYALSDRGGCHVRSNTIRTELMGLPEPIDRFAYEKKAAMVRDLQLTYATGDCVIFCMFGAFAIKMPDYAQAISAATGWDFDENELKTVAERSWNISRLFNTREGFTRKEDSLPGRLFKDPSTVGPSKGQIVHKEEFEKMLDEYYQIVGWDNNGKPTVEKLKELQIENM